MPKVQIEVKLVTDHWIRLFKSRFNFKFSKPSRGADLNFLFKMYIPVITKRLKGLVTLCRKSTMQNATVQNATVQKSHSAKGHCGVSLCMCPTTTDVLARLLHDHRRAYRGYKLAPPHFKITRYVKVDSLERSVFINLF